MKGMFAKEMVYIAIIEYFPSSLDNMRDPIQASVPNWWREAFMDVVLVHV